MVELALDDAIVSPRTYADPPAAERLFSQLRRDDPVHWTEPSGYRPFWTVAKYNDIREVEGAADIFLNAPRLVLRSAATEEQIRKATGGRTLLLRNLVNLDGAEHRRLRLLTQAWFMPPRLRALEADLKDLAATHVQRMAGHGQRCDFAQDVGRWYPLRVIMKLLGVPSADEPRMLKLTQQVFGPDDPEIKTDPGINLIASVGEFIEYFKVLIAKRRAEPTDDVASLIANAQFDGEAIGDLEAVSYYILIATAGHDTTSATLSGGLLALIENPEALAKLRTDPALLAGAIDEMVRWVTPVKHFFRTAAADYQLRGRHIREGQHLLMLYPSANRDEEIFDEPDRFDVGRTANRHIAFGFGPHVCLGQYLAKLELRIAFEALLERFDAFELDGEPAWLETNFAGGLKRLPIAFKERSPV